MNARHTKNKTRLKIFFQTFSMAVLRVKGAQYNYLKWPRRKMRTRSKIFHYCTLSMRNALCLYPDSTVYSTSSVQYSMYMVHSGWRTFILFLCTDHCIWLRGLITLHLSFRIYDHLHLNHVSQVKVNSYVCLRRNFRNISAIGAQ